MKAVLFDVDGVLLDSFETNVIFIQNLMKMTGYPPITSEEYKKMFHYTLRKVIEVHTKKDDAEINRILEIGKSGKVPYPRHLAKIPEHTESVMLKLSNFKLGVVTSRVGKNWLFKTNLKHLEKYFEVVVCYDDTEKHKPNPEPLLLAAKKLGIPPSECVYVGDAETDLLAAKAANMKIILYNNDLAGADAYANSFKELLDIVPKL